MSDNWVVQNINNALSVWNGKLSEIYSLITMTPEEFRDGAIWEVIENINGALVSIGCALLVIFFLIGMMKSAGSIADFKRPEYAVKVFIRFILAKAAVTWGMELMLALLQIVQGIISEVMNSGALSVPEYAMLPDSIVTSIESASFIESVPLWAVTLIGGIFIWVLSFIMILTVYGRFFRLYMYTALAPIPLSAFAGEPTSAIGKSFIKSYSAVCIEGVVTVLACIIFTVYASSSPSISESGSSITIVWSYIGEIIFNMLVLVSCIKMSDRVVREMLFS